MILKQLKYVLFFLLTFLLGAQATYAKTELILPIKSVSFTIEQNQSFKSLEKEVQPNIGFLKEKSKFEVSESVSALNTCNFSKEHLCYLAKAVGKIGPVLDDAIATTFTGGKYVNRQLTKAETFYKYHGVNNRTGRKYTWFTNKKYTDEESLRKGLAIRDDWGVEIKYISEFEAPKGTWVSEGTAASQGGKYVGGDYQNVVTNVPSAWIKRTDIAFSTKSIIKSGVKLGDEIINSVTGDIRKFSEYALKNPSKTGLFVDSWGYKLTDADDLLKTYKNQAIHAINNNKAIFSKTTSFGSEFKIEILLNTPLKGEVKVYSGWIVKAGNKNGLLLSSPFIDWVK